VFERLYSEPLRRSRDWRLAAVVEVNPDRVRLLRSRLTVPVVGALDEINEPVEAALILTPPATHAALATDAAVRGLHALVEKPMATSLEEARKMARAASDADRLLWVGFNRRFMAPLQRLKVSPVVGSHGVVWSGRLVTNPRRWGSVSGQPSDVLADAATHLVDLVPWLLRSEVRGVEGARYERRVGAETIVRFRLVCANGTTVDCAAGHGLRYEELLVVNADRKLWAASPRAMLGARMRESWLLRALTILGDAHAFARKSVGQPNTAQRSVAAMLERFAERARGGAAREDDPDSHAGIRAVAAVEAVYMSLESNGNVRAVATIEPEGS
jgi:predicted dehydrogenase